MTKPARWPAAATAPERALVAGTRVDDYEIEQTIADNGVSIVYRAFDLALGVQVALEEYMPEALALRSSDARVALRTRAQSHAFDEGRQAFVGEAQALARCDHPALLRFDRVLQRNGTVYRAMKLCSGPTLLDHRRAPAEPLDEATLERWLDDLQGALGALHAEGRVHGAVSPERIVLRDDGHLLLLDFDAVRSKLISGRTQEMMAALQPCFTAPEQRRPAPGQTVGPWSDLYALATTLRYCIDGEPPPPAAGLASAQPAGLVSDAWRRVHAATAAQDDAHWLHALDACLAEAPQDRPQSVARLREMIDDAAAFAPAAPAWPASRPAPLQAHEPELWPTDDGAQLPAAATPPAPDLVARPATAAIAQPAPEIASEPGPVVVAQTASALAARPAPAAAGGPAPEMAAQRAAVMAGADAASSAAIAADPAPAAPAATDPAPAAAAPAPQLAAANGAQGVGAAAAQADVAHMLADLEQTLARVTAIAGEEADPKRDGEAAPAAAAARVAPAAEPPLPPRQHKPLAWREWVTQRPVASLAAGIVALVAAGWVLLQEERSTAGPASSEVVPAVSAAVALPPPPSAALRAQQPAAGAQQQAAVEQPVQGASIAPAAAGGNHAAPLPPQAAATPPPPAAARARPAPRAQCKAKSGYALYQCMQEQCAKRSYAKHPQCVRLKRDQSLG